MGVVFDLLAAAGGGSGGYGGGGGGGGGGFGGGGGSGGSGDMPGWLWILIIAGAFLFFGLSALSTWRYARRRRARMAKVALAAAEAREDDPDFDPETVQNAAAALFVEIQRRWTEREVDGLTELVRAALTVEWRRRLDDFAAKGWHNIVTVEDGPEIEYAGLVNRAGEEEDRVVVRVSATLEDYVEDGDGRAI